MTTASKPTITIETTTNVWDIFDIVQPLAGHAVVAHAGGVRTNGSRYPLVISTGSIRRGGTR